MSRSFFLGSVLLFALCCSACGGNSSSSDGASDSGSELYPQGREASRNDTTVASLLADICGMKFSEANAIDDYQERIGKGMGPVPAALGQGAAVFSKASHGFCSARLVVVEGRFPVHYIMVLDLENDLVSAGRYDLAHETMEKWTEADSLEFPKLMVDWMAEMDTTHLFKVPDPISPDP